MLSHPSATPAAPHAHSARILPGCQFADAFRIAAPAGIDAIEATRLAFSHSPLWSRTLMGLRLVGLKAAPATGFPVIRQLPEEVVMGFDDKHLDCRVVVTLVAGIATITTIVRRHNMGGRAYLAAIMPFHRVIAARMLEGIA